MRCKACKATVGVIRHELGAAEARVAVADAEGVVASLAAGRDWAGDEAFMATLLCDHLWRQLSRRRPEAFGLSRMAPIPLESIDFSLAYRYTRTRRPDDVPSFELSGEERARMKLGRSVLREWTGLDSFTRACQFVSVRPETILHTVLAEHAPAYAWSLTATPGLRRVVLVDELSLAVERTAGRDVATRLLHEEIHAAHFSAADRVAAPSGELARMVEETVAQIIEAAIDLHLILEEAPTAPQLDQFVQFVVNDKAARVLLDHVNQQSVPAAVHGAARLAIDVTCAGSDENVASILNARFGSRRTSAQWKRRLDAQF